MQTHQGKFIRRIRAKLRLFFFLYNFCQEELGCNTKTNFDIFALCSQTLYQKTKWYVKKEINLFDVVS